jgi:hypothetical protein
MKEETRRMVAVQGFGRPAAQKGHNMHQFIILWTSSLAFCLDEENGIGLDKERKRK